MSHLKGTLYMAGAREIWIHQSGFSRRENLYYPGVKLTSQEKNWSQATFLTGESINMQEKVFIMLQFQKPNQFGKSEKKMNHFVFESFTFSAKYGSAGFGIESRS